MSASAERQHDLDLARVLAMSMVFVFHFFLAVGRGADEMWFSVVRNGGWAPMGIGVFYALSGYLLQLHDSKTETLTFWKKRFSQLIPMQILVFIPSYLYFVHLTGNPYYGGYIERLVFSFLGIDGYLAVYGNPTYILIGEWYTAVILLLYLLFPLLRTLYKKHFCIISIIIVMDGNNT